MVESFKGDLILTGGRSTGGISFANDVWRSSDGSSWSRVTKSAPWGERAYHILVTGSDGCLILMGGQTFSKTYNDVWKSCDGESWQQVTANAPWPARAGLAATVHNGTIVVAGGCYNIPNSGTPPKRGFFNDVWRSDDNGQTWQVATKAAPWSGRSGPRLVTFKDQLFLVAGERGFTPDVQLKEVWSSPDGGASWTLVNKTPAFSARSGHGLVVTPSKSHMLLLAGWPELHDMWSSSDGALWVQESTSVWNCHGPTRDDKCGKFDFWSLFHKGDLFTVGGSGAYETFGKMFKDTWSLSGSALHNL